MQFLQKTVMQETVSGKKDRLKLINAINESIGDKHIIAEDLGIKMPEVVEVLENQVIPA